MSELSERLKTLREEKNISMDKMCEDLSKIYNVKLAKSTISKWENGKSEPTMSYARVLSKYFNVSLDYIIGLTDIKDIDVPEEYSSKYKVTKRDLNQYQDVLSHAQAFMMDDKADPNDKQKLFEIVSELYWESKANNKKKYGKKKDNK